ncbi:heme exporter protein CcmD [Endozoicomonas arenosclerae]|uniref:heme exporter protein CcmD n=1 Tax=Endozoicomonas arenosclerae TaxID=1633495 RepID=UPI000782A6E1|nr:heme exporter protein CcmD [Endozoicomonas arenosclerae]
MYFESFASLIHMDGHGMYVWPTYGIGLLIIAYNIISPLRARKRIVAQIQRQVRGSQSRSKSFSQNNSLSQKKSFSHKKSHSPAADHQPGATDDLSEKKKAAGPRVKVSTKNQGVREGEVE